VLHRLVRSGRRSRGQAVFRRQDCLLYARAPHDRHSQARPAEKLGFNRSRGQGLLLRENTLNSPIGMRSYHQVRSILNRATAELAILDMLRE
jgi:hypothetical protein